MILKEWLKNHKNIFDMDYTYYDQNGRPEYDFVNCNEFKKLPSKILNSQVIKAEFEEFDGEITAYLDLKA